MDDRIRALQAAIAALQAQRPLLGDAVVDTAVAPLQEQLEAAQAAQRVPAAQPAQQLRQVSVLFLDVVGSTALSQLLDPEDVSAVMDGVLARGTTLVQAHGGRVLQYAGDNILAAFGAERAEEDDAERAVHCGLALLEEGRALGERVHREHGHAGCSVRVGIHTGPVLLGGGVDEEGTIRGLTVNIAARMEQTAPHGAVRISHDTWLQVRGAFECEAQPPLQVKGRDEAILTYLVQRARPLAERVVARGIDGVATPLTGRGAELALLLAARDEVARTRSTRALTLVAEPGLGKSRLLAELRARLASPTQGWWPLPARTHPQTRGQPYGLLRDLLARQLQIADSDTLQAAQARFEGGLLPWLPGEQGLVHRLGQLIGIDFGSSPHLAGCTPAQMRASGLDALRRWLAALAADGSATALLLEDLHWADDASLDLLAELIGTPGTPGTTLPLFVVASTRPELLERRPDWATGNPVHHRLPLAPLGAGDDQQLAAALLRRLEGDAQHGAVHALLCRQAAGNPFFMEELLRMLRDDGVISSDGERWQVQAGRLAAARVPGTLVGVLQARLDTLPAADRQALQQASIFGSVFWDEALAALDRNAPASIPALQARALVLPQPDSAFEGAHEETFSHHLLQQVTYDTVLKSARRAGHAAAAAWLAQRVGDRSSEYLAVTAEHYERAGEHGQAFAYFQRAAAAAAARYANSTALDYVARALASPGLGDDPRQRIALLAHRSQVLDVLGRRQEQQQALDEREAAARAFGNESLLADALFAQALLASRRSDEGRAMALALEAATLARRSGNRGTAALALAQVAWARHIAGDNPQGLLDAREALAQLRATPDDGSVPDRAVTEIKLLTMVGAIERASGLMSQAGATLREGLALARSRGNRRTEHFLFQYLAVLARDLGQLHDALALFQDSLRSAQDVGLTASIGFAQQDLARTLLLMGRATEAVSHLEHSRALALAAEDRRQHARTLTMLGWAATKGAPGDPGALLQQALGEYAALDFPLERAQPLAWLTLWQLERGALADAQAGADELDRALRAHKGFEAGTDPLLPLWACHCVRAASGDARAEATRERLRQAYTRHLGTIREPELRRSAQQNVPLFRDIAAALGITGAA